MDSCKFWRISGFESGDTCSQGLCFRKLTKAFGGNTALDAVSFQVLPGTIHALVGENGAGKSTLINCATGVLQPDSGEALLNGKGLEIRDPRMAAEYGIHAVHQEADYFPELSLAENMLLGQGLARKRNGLIDWRSTWQQAEDDLAAFGMSLPVQNPARNLSVGQRVMTGIAACMAVESEVIFLDEPTASLTNAEAERLFEQLCRLRDKGVTIIYVSHRLEEVLEISDWITVLRDGRCVGSKPVSGYDMDSLVAAMVGRETQIEPSRHEGEQGYKRLSVRNFSDRGGRFHEVSLDLHEGEIVGLYGLIGAGRTDLAHALFGLRSAIGYIAIGEKEVVVRSPQEAKAFGIAYVPEDRRSEAIFATHSCRENVSSALINKLGWLGFIGKGRERRMAELVVKRFDVRLGSVEQSITTLSGGNQQKLVLGRWVETDPDILILDEPTRGVDIGAKTEIHRLARQLAKEGKSILLISSDLPEVMHLSDRVVTMAEGRVCGEFDPRTTTEHEVASSAIPVAKPSDKDEKEADITRVSSPGRLLHFQEAGILTALIAISAVMTLLRPSEFATLANLVDVLTAASIVSVLAAGMALVLISGSIDISVGSMLGLVAAVSGIAARNGVPPVVCLGLGIAMGSALGLLNAGLSALGRIHPIIVTLAGIYVYRGVMLLVTGGYEVAPLPDGFRALVDGRLLGLPKVLWYAIPVLALNWILIGHTFAGRAMLAVGNSEKAARLIGLSPVRSRLLAFGLLGASVGLAAVMWGGYYGKIQSNTGTGLELQVIAAAVIGGCSIMGGKGTALGVFSGAVLIALIYNALILLRVSSFWQNIFVGGLILAAVLWDIWLPRILNRRRSE